MVDLLVVAAVFNDISPYNKANKSVENSRLITVPSNAMI